MANTRLITNTVVVSIVVGGTLIGAVVVGFSPLLTGVLVLAAFGGGSLLARGANLLRGAELVAAKARPTYSLAQIAAMGREQASKFHALSARIKDATLKGRVGHIGDRLGAVFAEIERRPEAMDDMAAVHAFVLDFLPRSATIIERYIELVGKLDGGDSPQIRAVVATVNDIADTVKRMHERLVSHELAEFASANLVLQTELELDNPALRLSRRQEESS